MQKNEKQSYRKAALIVSITLNIGILVYFKYFNFLAENFIAGIHQLQLGNIAFNPLQIILPLGLSFHTFQALSYTIEVYRKQQIAATNLFTYALYVLYFPQLVAGPIEKPQRLLPQFNHYSNFDIQNLINGSRLMLWGFFKKIVIADRIAAFVNYIFEYHTQFEGFEILLACMAFYFQIYCDFSGYSDIAVGCSKCLGIDLMQNFDRPYLATSIKSFWQKWHISLTNWFREYVYISLGGNKKGFLLQQFFILLVFLLSGFWHGANWTFIIWGLIHAVGSILYALFSKKQKATFPVFSWLFTFIFVSISWLYFRAETIAKANEMGQKIFNFSSNYFQLKAVPFFTTYSIIICIFSLLMMILVERKSPVSLANFSNHKTIDFVFFTMLLVMIGGFGIFSAQKFIYFQF